jgi:hypothetical protein
MCCLSSNRYICVIRFICDDNWQSVFCRVIVRKQLNCRGVELANRMVMSRQVLWWDVSHCIVDMSVEEDPRKKFGEVIRFVDRSIDPFEDNEVSFDPFTKDVVPDVHMTSATSQFLSVSHSRTSILVFVEPASGLLRNVEVP